MMRYEADFTLIELRNRLGQQVSVSVTHMSTDTRDYVFLTAAGNAASSLVAKNADHFAFQLRDHFSIEPNRFELIELRVAGDDHCLWRWRFEWVGFTPLAPKGEAISSVQQQHKFFAMLAAPEQQPLAAVTG